MLQPTEKDIPSDSDNDESGDETEEFDRLFSLYSKIGSSASENTMSLQGAKLWLEQANILEEFTGIPETDVEDTFSAADVTGMKKEEFKAWLEKLAKQKKISSKDLMNKLINSGPPAAGNQADLNATTGENAKPDQNPAY